MIVTSRSQDKLAHALASFRERGFQTIDGISGKIEDKATAESLFRDVRKNFGKIDILINNAGTWEPAKFQDITEEQIDSNLSVLKGTFFVTQSVVKDWLESRQKGVVVNIGSASVGRPQIASPCLPHVFQKSGMHEMSKALAVELAPVGIRSNTISLGTVGDEAYEKQLPKEVLALYPMGRIGKLYEVAETAAYLADDEKSGWVTGTEIHMDGGQHASR